MNTARIYCVRCSQPVNPGTSPVTGRPIHVGHVDPKLDATCGTWGHRPERPSDREED